MIKTSFPKCCITNAIDGTEEDNIWEEQTDPFDDLMMNLTMNCTMQTCIERNRQDLRILLIRSSEILMIR